MGRNQERGGWTSACRNRWRRRLLSVRDRLRGRRDFGDPGGVFKPASVCCCWPSERCCRCFSLPLTSTLPRRSPRALSACRLPLRDRSSAECLPPPLPKTPAAVRCLSRLRVRSGPSVAGARTPAARGVGRGWGGCSQPGEAAVGSASLTHTLKAPPPRTPGIAGLAAARSSSLNVMARGGDSGEIRNSQRRHRPK